MILNSYVLDLKNEWNIIPMYSSQITNPDQGGRKVVFGGKNGVYVLNK